MNIRSETSEILLVEDNAGDIYMFENALKISGFKFNLIKIKNGDDVLPYLKRNDISLPDIIILDLNLPGKNGKEILFDIKNDERLGLIPVIIFTTSNAEYDIQTSYKLKANCFIKKPISVTEYIAAVNRIKEFWTAIVTLPNKE
jgi:chemotaxis family two-component system response regulator Rcp1